MTAQILTYCTQTDPGDVTSRVAPAARMASLTVFDIAGGPVAADKRIDAAGGAQSYALGVRSLR